MANTESEFGGVQGMIQPKQIGHEDEDQWRWEVYGTNVGMMTADGTEQLDPTRVGWPPESSTQDG